MLPPNPPGPSAAQAAASVGVFAAQNTAVAAAPLLTSVNPALNPVGVGGLEVTAITGGLNAIVQWLKMHDWFDQNRWSIPLMVVLGLGIALALWHDDIRRAFLNAMLAVDTAIKNYGTLKPIGALQPGTATAKDAES